jgi:adenosylcobinamide-phosphate synthase
MSRLALVALVLEAALGYPEAVQRRAPHPVVGLGRAIAALERRWNGPERSEAQRRGLGVAALLLVGGGAALAGALATRAARGRAGAGAVLALAATAGLAQRSLYDHVAAVLAALERDDLPAARAAVARIVGRDTHDLNASEVAAAALESLAESFCDGVVAPALWLAAGGLPGLFAYKAVNTADSMIGHREPRWRSFGWAAARTDDAMNLVPARVAGALIAAAGGGGWTVMARDAAKHASPNAGWPEAAMAGALGVRLGGPARYDGLWTRRPVFGDGPAPTAEDLKRGLAVYIRACGLLWLTVGGLACRR